MNIGSKSPYPAGTLSNFTPFPFIIDGVLCNSMEGFLQSLKYENISSQKITCSLVGIAAKRKGQKRNKYWQSKQCLWWCGKPYKRDSDEYQMLLNRAYMCLYEQNPKFRKALQDAKDAIFTHSIGKNNSKETVITSSEFCHRLQKLKDFGSL